MAQAFTFGKTWSDEGVTAKDKSTIAGNKQTKDGEEDNRNSPGFENEEKDQKEIHSEAENAIVGDQTIAGGIKGASLEEKTSLTEKNNTTQLDKLNDVFLVMDGRRLPASKVVLCLASPVFQSMVESSLAQKQEFHLHGKAYGDVKEFYSCIDPRTMTPITDRNIYTVLPLIHEFKVECLLQRCQVFLPDKVNEFMGAKELCRHLHLAVNFGLFDLEVKCLSLCSELKLAEMVEWMSHYNIPDPVQLKVRDRSLHRHELEEDDTIIITLLYKHAGEEIDMDFPNLLGEELKQNHFAEAFKESSVDTSNRISQPGTVPNHPTNNTVKSTKNKRNFSGTQSDNRGPTGFGTTTGTTALFGPSVTGVSRATTTTTGLFGHASTGGFDTTASTTGLFGQASTCGFGTSTSTTGPFGQSSTGGWLLQSTGLTVSTKSVNILKFLQGMRLFYKYLEDTHSDMKKEVVQFMRSQMNNLSTKEREIFDLLPERAKHDVKGRFVKEIPDKN